MLIADTFTTAILRNCPTDSTIFNNDIGHHSTLASLTSMPQLIPLLAPQNFPYLGTRPSIPVSSRVFFVYTNRARNSESIAPCSLDFLTDVGRRLNAATGDARQTAFLFQRISVAI